MTEVCDCVFRLPPFRKDEAVIALSQTIDWGHQLLGVETAWKAGRGEGVKVAILDTGVAVNHPDLQEKVLDAADFTGSVGKWVDSNGHGTFCAGLIAALDNDLGVVGVAPDCQLLCGKVLGDGAIGGSTPIVEGIRWAIKKGAHVISMSLGSPKDSPIVHAAVQEAVAAGVFVVAAAGNEGPNLDSVNYPAKYQEVVSVGAIDRNAKVANFSSRGERIDICAPGDKVLSCYPPNGYMRLSGSSMAAPFVAGVTALLLSSIKKFNLPPLTSVEDLKTRIRSCAIDAGPSGFDQAYGFGIINPISLLGLDVKHSILTVRPEDLSSVGLAKLGTVLETGGVYSGEIVLENGLKAKIQFDMSGKKPIPNMRAPDYVNY